jgi:hypothetical protein
MLVKKHVRNIAELALSSRFHASCVIATDYIVKGPIPHTLNKLRVAGNGLTARKNG